MAVKKLVRFLEQNHVNYRTVPHPVRYTAQEVAHSAHVKGKQFAKSVLVDLDGELTMVVLPAPYRVNLKKLKEMTGARRAALAREEDFRDRFPDCTIGAMPPFGNLYNLPVIADVDLQEDEEISFNAGSHSEAITLARSSYDRLVHPRYGDVHRHNRRWMF